MMFLRGNTPSTSQSSLLEIDLPEEEKVDAQVTPKCTDFVKEYEPVVAASEVPAPLPIATDPIRSVGPRGQDQNGIDEEVAMRIMDIKDRALGELKSYSNPGKRTERVMKAVAILFGIDVTEWNWSKAKLMLKDSKAFVQKMLDFKLRYVTGKMIRLLQRFENSELNQPGMTKNISEAVHVIWSWVASIASKSGVPLKAN